MSHANPPRYDPQTAPGIAQGFVQKPADVPEHSLEWYAREIARSSARTAQNTAFIAWVIGLGAFVAVVFGIIGAVELAHIASQVTQTATNTVP